MLETLEETTTGEQPEDSRLDALFATVRQRLIERSHVPVATYRVQFNHEFTFADAQRQVAYLRALGISDLYASPYFKARPGSMHGYDIVNHNQLNPEVGTPEEYAALVAELQRQGMAQVLDIVPNHMGIGDPGNGWWLDVLENGPASLYASFFDIEWDPIDPTLRNKVLLPILGDQYGKVLEKGELQLGFAAEEGRFWLHYYETLLPIAPRSYQELLQLDLAALLTTLGEESAAAQEYQSIITAAKNLPEGNAADAEQLLERNREKEVIKRRLAALVVAEPRVLAHIEANIARYNGTPGEPRSFDLLDQLLAAQSYRLSFWRVAAEEINYRRFFDINELAAINVDQPAVFRETHRMIMQLVAAGKVNGLRIDHVDGLRDPAGYFQNLQRAYFAAISRAAIDELDEELSDADKTNLEVALLGRFEEERAADPASPLQRPLYVVVEKILGRSERMPIEWAVNGTTGYEYTNAVNGLFVNGANAKAFDVLYATVLGEKPHWADLVYESKRRIMQLALSSEVNMLTNMLTRIAQANRLYRDFTLYSLRQAIREIIACFPVYRTYISSEQPYADERDTRFIEVATARAKSRNPAVDPSMFDFVRDVLLLKNYETLGDDARVAYLNFVLKFQQVTGPVVAKGVEDTAFYVYNRLIALNEVGGEPEYFGLSTNEFHRQQAERQRRWPSSLLTTSTHDTKRSEDTRARIAVLSERPQELRAALRRWARMNRKHKRRVSDELAPDANEEYFLYQSMLGVWPFTGLSLGNHDDLTARLCAYMRKALNEAKVHTSWVNTNEEYLTAVCDFVTAILQQDATNRFLPDFAAFAAEVAHYGVFNSLSQALLKITSPGVPDIYQGNELWDFSLVDPDNRRPVDYDLRHRLLKEVSAIADREAAAALVEAKEDGRIKLLVTSRALNFRREHQALYQNGGYTALTALGNRAERIVAFARSNGEELALTVAPILSAGLAKMGERVAPIGAVWADNWLLLPGVTAGQSFRNVFTGEILEATEREGAVGLPLEGVLAAFPVALLERV